MALLPLAGFADNITVMPANLQFEYSDPNIPTEEGTATEDMVAVVGSLPEGVSKAQVAQCLTFIPKATIAGIGTYAYGLVVKDDYATTFPALASHVITISGGNGQIEILKKLLTADMIGNIADVTFKAAKWEPEITVTGPTADDYDVFYGDDTHDNINQGTGIVKIKAKAESMYRGEATKTFTINKAELSTLSFSSIEDQTYTGSEIKKVPTITSGDFTLAATDYAVTYTNNTDVSTEETKATGVVTAAADGNFTFADDLTEANRTFTFNIVKKNVTDDENIAFADLKNINFAETSHEQVTAGVGAIKLNWIQGTGDDATTTDILSSFDIRYENNTNVGTATIIATAKENSNFTGTVKGTFSILPASIASATIALKKQNGDEWVNATFVYDGTKIQPGTVAKDGKLVVTLGTTELEQGKDFKIVGYGLGDGEDNVNATESDAKASVTIQGMGNYDAVDGNADPIQVKQTFQIKKRLLELSAKHDVKTFYGVSPVDRFGYTSNYVVLDENGNVVEQEEGAEDKGAEALGYTVTYKVYQDGSSETLVDEADYTSIPVSTVDYYYMPELTLLPTLPENESDVQEGVIYATPEQIAARANYTFEGAINQFAFFEVEQAKLIIVPASKEQKYSVAEPNFANWAYTIYNGEVAEANKVASSTDDGFNPSTYFTTAPTFAREAGTDVKYEDEAKTKVTGYRIYVSNQTGNGAVASNSYTFEFREGMLTITPFPITITANDQTILYGSKPNTEVGSNQFVKTVNEETKVEGYGTALTVTFSPAATISDLIMLEDLGLKLTWDENGTVGPHDGALVPSITNKNFLPNPVSGKVTVVNSAAIELVRVGKDDFENATVAAYVNNYDKVTANVTIKSTDATTTTFKKNQWYTMVLPFETDTKTISNAFGYAIVDLLRTANDNPSRVYFDLHMNTEKIPANTPFLLKAWDDIDMENEGVSFTGVKIQKPAGVEGNGNMFATDVAGNMFIGTYEGILNLGDGTHGNNIRVYSYGAGELGEASATYYLRQMSAYISLVQGNARIFVEDLDENGTTVIKELNVATGEAYAVDGWYTLNGVKLQAAPTEKGVYINNGKKVVLK